MVLPIPMACAIVLAMNTTPGKRTAKVRLTLTKRTVEALEPAEKSWIAWDEKLTGFGSNGPILVS